MRLATPAVVACVLLGAFAGAGAYTANYSEATSYLSDDPRACVNCHVMREHYDGWQKASHHQHATCNGCHTPPGVVRKYASKAENGFWHSKGFTLQDFPEPIRIRPHNRAIVNENCARCHEALVSELLASERGRANRTHHAGDTDCIRCHAAVGHGPPR